MEASYNNQQVKQRCLVFEYLDQSLYQLLRNSNFKGFDLDTVRIIGYQLAQALEGLHRLHIVHCDLKVCKSPHSFTHSYNFYFYAPYLLIFII
jgi:serine/threonine protein kinase